jgi:hypothetical protein
MDAVQTLQKDKDRDVIFYSGGDPPPRGRPIDEPLLPEEVSLRVRCNRDLFINEISLAKLKVKLKPVRNIIK